jgi:hypothetical protein
MRDQRSAVRERTGAVFPRRCLEFSRNLAERLTISDRMNRMIRMEDESKELKATQCLVKAHEVQVVNYLTATNFEEGVLLNFGAARLEFKKKFRFPKTEQASL